MLTWLPKVHSESIKKQKGAPFAIFIAPGLRPYDPTQHNMHRNRLLRKTLSGSCPVMLTDYLVPTARLELAQLSPLPPQDSVSTNFTTSAGFSLSDGVRIASQTASYSIRVFLVPEATGPFLS
jgi:hypothetical protein